jgi:hypothetical protein
MNELQDVYNVTMNNANPQEYVPEVERNNSGKIWAAFINYNLRNFQKSW